MREDTVIQKEEKVFHNGTEYRVGDLIVVVRPAPNEDEYYRKYKSNHVFSICGVRESTYEPNKLVCHTIGASVNERWSLITKNDEIELYKCPEIKKSDKILNAILPKCSKEVDYWIYLVIALFISFISPFPFLFASVSIIYFIKKRKELRKYIDSLRW